MALAFGIIEEIEQLHIFNQGYSLLSSDEQRFRIANKCLRHCPYFATLLDADANLREVSTFVSSATTRTLRFFLETGRLPVTEIDGSETFELMLLGRTLNWPLFSAHCAAAASGVAAPAGAEPLNVRAVIEDLIRYLPLRSVEHYGVLFEMLESAATADGGELDVGLQTQTLDNVKAIVREKAEHEEFHLLSVPLFAKQITVALLRNISGENTVAFLKNGRSWEPVADLFGSEFCPFEAGVTDFYLCFGKHVVYRKEDTSVWKKELRRSDHAEEEEDRSGQRLLETSKFFRSRLGQLHVIYNDGPYDVVLEWCPGGGGFFDQKFAIPECSELLSAHNDDNGRLVVVRADSSWDRVICVRQGHGEEEDGEEEDGAEERGDNDGDGGGLEADQLLDKLGPWKRTKDVHDGFFYRTLGEGTDQMEDVLEEPSHIGYSTIETQTFFDKVPRTYLVKANSDRVELGIHGSVYALSDVFLGDPMRLIDE